MPAPAPPPGDDTGAAPSDRDATTGPPRWVYGFGIAGVVLLVLFVVVHLAGGGFRHHELPPRPSGHGSHQPAP